MTPDGLERTDRLDPNELKKGNYKLKDERYNREENNFENQDGPTIIDTVRRTDTSSVRLRVTSVSMEDKGAEAPYSSEAKHADLSTPLSVFSRLFQ
jgi:hypothetical protein